MLKEANRSDNEGTFDISGISDEVMTIFSWFVFGGLCLVIGSFGIVTNVINIICFIKQGFEDSVNISLVALSVSDLCSLIILSWLNILYTPAVLTADLTFDPIDVCFFASVIPHLTLSQVSSWITALITLERCLCVIAPLKGKSIFTPRRTKIIVVFFYFVFIAVSSPMYAINKLDWKFYQQRNKTLLGLVHKENTDTLRKIMYIMNNFSIPLTAFTVIVFCTGTLVIKLQNATKWRHKSVAAVQVDRVSIRNQKVAKMVMMISALFIICFIPICITMLTVAFEPSISYGGKYLNIGVVLGGICFILQSINSSMNIVIYYYMSSKYRETFQEIFGRMLQLNCQTSEVP